FHVTGVQTCALPISVFPVIIGDTITYTDLKIQQLNVNKYDYLKNSFPIEVFLVYNGDKTVTSNFVVTNGSATVYSQTLSFSKDANSKVINFALPANNVGVSTYKAHLTPLESEKNKVNNTKNFAVEIIDQKTKVALVSDFIHPDLGAFKKSIESNEQREVVFLNPNESINQINDFQLFILYQPNLRFNSLIEALNKENKNRFVVLGTQTDLRFFNRVNSSYSHDITNDTEDYQGALNLNYTPFMIDDIDFGA